MSSREEKEEGKPLLNVVVKYNFSSLRGRKINLF